MGVLATFEKKAADQFAREFERLFYARDVAGLTSYYTEDAKLMVEEHPTMQGHRAIEEFWRAVFATVGSAKRSITIEEIEASGDLGYMVATVSLSIPLPGGQAINSTIKDITVWRREADGWRMAVDTSSRNAPLAMPGR
jgi:ketosteroid isomerase-like protein